MALASEGAARAEAERRAAERKAADGMQITMYTSFAIEQDEPLEVRGSQPQTCMQYWLPVWPINRQEQAMSDGQPCETCCLHSS